MPVNIFNRSQFGLPRLVVFPELVVVPEFAPDPESFLMIFSGRGDFPPALPPLDGFLESAISHSSENYHQPSWYLTGA